MKKSIVVLCTLALCNIQLAALTGNQVLKKVEDLISSMHSRHSNIQEDFNTLRQQLRKLT